VNDGDGGDDDVTMMMKYGNIIYIQAEFKIILKIMKAGSSCSLLAGHWTGVPLLQVRSDETAQLWSVPYVSALSTQPFVRASSSGLNGACTG
jgi:hypothetical protein